VLLEGRTTKNNRGGWKIATNRWKKDVRGGVKRRQTLGRKANYFSCGGQARTQQANVGEEHREEKPLTSRRVKGRYTEERP